MRRALVLSSFLIAVTTTASSATLSRVTVSPSSFNPSIQQTVSISFESDVRGTVSVQVIDRDGYVVRELEHDSRVAAGHHKVTWDGRNDRGEVVPDEAWSFRISLKTARGATEWFPASRPQHEATATDVTYDRSSGIIRYVLSAPSRVHLQAGCARVVDQSGRREGPVMRTVTNREPRIAGSVIEHWNGLDASGAISVPDLPDFVLGVAATALPEQAVITTGNRKIIYAESVTGRTGHSLLPPREDHSHHAGLSSSQDVSPPIRLERRDARDDKSRTWMVSESPLRFSVRAEGPAAADFVEQRGSIQLFVDGVRVSESPAVENPSDISLDTAALSPGRHIVAVNWASPFGPVAVNAVAIDVIRQRETR